MTFIRRVRVIRRVRGHHANRPPYLRPFPQLVRAGTLDRASFWRGPDKPIEPPLWFSDSMQFARAWQDVFANEGTPITCWEFTGLLAVWPSVKHFVHWAAERDVLDWKGMEREPFEPGWDKHAEAADAIWEKVWPHVRALGADGTAVWTHFGSWFGGPPMPGHDIAIWSLEKLRSRPC